LKYKIKIADAVHLVELPESGDIRQVTVDGRELPVELVRFHRDGEVELLLDGHSFVAGVTDSDGGCQVELHSQEITATVWDERNEAIRKLTESSKKRSDIAGEVRAPMPGLVVMVEIAIGDQVKRGQGVVIIEAMKMENEIAASTDGTVQQIKVEAGRAVEKGELLLVIQ